LGWLLAGLLLCPLPARANGRFPAADQLLIDPDDTTHLVLRATFGLLESRDGGRNWSWICEGAVGYSNADPALALLRGGNVLAGFFGIVSVSAEQSCSWRSEALDQRYQYPFDATLDPADPSRAWVLAVSVDGTRLVHLLSVDDSGVIGEVLPVGDGFVPVTVEVAPSNPARIYVTGIEENVSSLVLRSDDRGQTWTRRVVTGHGALPLFISAVDPNDPNRVYARIDGSGASVAQPAAANDDPSDHLLVSQDGGDNWDTVFSLEADLLGFALSPDGSTIAVGGPGKGLYVASSSELDFQPAAPVQALRCLKWTADGLFACGQESLDGWTIGRSLDVGQSFEAFWHQQALTPLECAASSTTGAVCPATWAEIARTIDADPDLVPNGGTPNGGTPNGGTEPTPGPAPALPSADSGCVLGIPAQHSVRLWGGLVAALALLSARRRQLRCA
jgi:photosystem II stability/assembly factor-like uncharacterized protein